MNLLALETRRLRISSRSTGKMRLLPIHCRLAAAVPYKRQGTALREHRGATQKVRHRTYRSRVPQITSIAEHAKALRFAPRQDRELTFTVAQF